MKRILFFLILLPCTVWGSVEIGIGQNSAFSGRIVPALTLAITNSNHAVSFYSAGVQNEYYYHSVYGLNYFRQKKTGDLFGGEVVCGLGLGLMYAQRGFQDLDAPNEVTKSDVAFGPAFRVNWTPFPHIFLNFDATYGLREFGSHILMNFQDVITFSMGVRF